MHRAPMVVRDKFEEDLEAILGRLNAKPRVSRRLNDLSQKLITMKRANLVKINHSVMELLCASVLLKSGYEVDVEHEISESLICDVYGTTGEGTLVVEIETGFVPPEHALDPNNYTTARIISKVARYSAHADRFGLCIPTHILLPIPEAILRTPRDRTEEDVRGLKAICDLYYSHPPISREEITEARLHTVYIMDIDQLAISEIDPAAYIRHAGAWGQPPPSSFHG